MAMITITYERPNAFGGQFKDDTNHDWRWPAASPPPANLSGDKKSGKTPSGHVFHENAARRHREIELTAFLQDIDAEHAHVHAVKHGKTLALENGFIPLVRHSDVYNDADQAPARLRK
jgi:hypothetical protein